MSKLSTFAKFVGRYAGEIRTIGTLVSGVLAALPIGREDRENLQDKIANLFAAADRIEASLSSLGDAVGLSRDEIKEIVREIVRESLPDMIGGAVETATRQRLAADFVERNSLTAQAPAPAADPSAEIIDTAPPAAKPPRVRNRSRLPKAGEAAE